MFSDSPQQRMTSAPQDEGIVARAAAQVRQFVCGLHGHDSLLHFEHGRISLLCTSCGHETPGWDVKAAQRDVVDASPRIVSMPLVHERRVA